MEKLDDETYYKLLDCWRKANPEKPEQDFFNYSRSVCVAQEKIEEELRNEFIKTGCFTFAKLGPKS